MTLAAIHWQYVVLVAFGAFMVWKLLYMVIIPWIQKRRQGKG